MTSSAPVTYEDLAKMKREVLSLSAPASIMKEVSASTKFRRMLNADMSIGRSLIGPQWIDTVAIEDGAVTADKLVANLVLSTKIIAGADSPADRLTLDATGMKAYGTVSGVANTQTLSIGNNGNFSFGISPNQITFTASTGTLVVPAAVITSLTIAAVSSGIIGGNYDTSAATAKLRISTAGIVATNSAGATTVNLNATTGAFTLSDDPAGANRITIANTGIELWKSSTRQFYLATGGATNAITMLLTGPGASDYIGMNPSDGLWLGASTYAGASTKFRVSPAGVLQAASATISGAITATSGDLQTLSVSGTLTLGVGGLLRTSSSTSRVEMDNTGIYGYNAGTARFQVLNAGSGFLGASTTLSWTSAGAVTLAGFKAGSTLLSSGTGGSYVTMSSSTTAFSAGGATPASAPFNVSNAGAMTATSATITGAITATSGRLHTLTVSDTLTVGQSGVYTGRIRSYDGTGYNSSGIYMEKASGAGTYVSFGTKFTWDGTTLTINGGGTFSGALSAATGTFAGSLSAASGSFTGSLSGATGSFSGSLTASSLSITGAASFSGGSLTLPSGGTITASTLDMNSGTMSGLTIDGNLTMAAGGKILLSSAGRIEDADGSYWDQTGLTLFSPPSSGDTVLWKYSGWLSNRPYSALLSYGSSTQSGLSVDSYYGNGGSITTLASTDTLANSTSGQVQLVAGPSSGLTYSRVIAFGSTTASNSYVEAQAGGRYLLTLEYTNRRALFYGRIYPGADSDTAQTTGYIAWDGANIATVGADLYVQGHLRVINTGTTGTGALPNPTKWVKIKDSAGTTWRVPAYQDNNTWTA